MKKLSILFAAFAVLFLVSCGKYEDGPGFSLRSKAGRVAGSWTYDKVYINDVDVTSATFSADENYTMEFTKDGGYTFSYAYLGQTYSDAGKWEFANSNESIKITDSYGDVETYKILRLTNTEMWWSETDGTDTYEIHLKAK
jgi:hypothetical protein